MPEITDTEEVTGSNPVSPTSNTPSHVAFAAEKGVAVAMSDSHPMAYCMAPPDADMVTADRVTDV